MKNSYKYLKSFWHDETGATAIEYGLIISLVVIGLIASLQALGGTNGGALEQTSDAVVDAIAGAAP